MGFIKRKLAELDKCYSIAALDWPGENGFLVASEKEDACLLFSEEGELLDTEGKLIGHHRGALRYTLGQRRGLNFPAGERVYVVGKDMEKNTVTLGPESALYRAELLAGRMNWLSIPEPSGPIRVTARTRYRQTERPALATPLPGGRLRLVFDEPQRAITPGQAVVLYDGDLVLGGGTILAEGSV